MISLKTISKNISEFSIFNFIFAFFGLMLLLAITGFVYSSVKAQSASVATIPNTNITYTKLATSPDEIPTIEEEMDYELDASGDFFAKRLVVKFNDEVSDSTKKNIIKSLNAKFIREDYDLSGAKEIYVNTQDRDTVFESLKSNSNVEYVEKSGVEKIIAPIDPCYPNDPEYCAGNQSSLDSIFAPAGWVLKRGSSSVVTAVIDTGVDYNHSDLVNKVILGFDFTDPPGSQGYADPMDDQGHGTFVAGIIAASTNNSANIAGIDWNGKILAMRACLNGVISICPSSAVTSAINYTANYYPNVKVINLSLSAGNTNSNSRQDAIENAQNKGKVVVAGAAHPAGPDGNCFIGFPAAYPQVVSVVGLNEQNQRASGCTQSVLNGQTWQGVIISAPSTNLTSLALGGGVDFYGPASTSFATPFVSGVAAVLASCSNSINGDLVTGAIDLGPTGYDGDTGFGKVNLWKALVQTCFDSKGDVDCNGTVNSIDALNILKYKAGLKGGTYNAGNCPINIYLPQADVDRDTQVTVIDALYILQLKNGLRTTDTLELIPPAVDTDGDGMTDSQEFNYSCLNPTVSDSLSDFDNEGFSNSAELVLGSNPCVSDGDGDGFSDYAEFYVGTDVNLRCGENAWPADFNNDNKVNIFDLASFVAPIRHLGTSKGDSNYDIRWDLVPGKSGLSADINIIDLSAIVVLYPPMLGSQRAMNGPVCTP